MAVQAGKAVPLVCPALSAPGWVGGAQDQEKTFAAAVPERGKGQDERGARILAGDEGDAEAQGFLQSGQERRIPGCCEGGVRPGDGKDVFAVPGSIYSNVSKGTNDLIQNGAYMALSPQNMAQQLGWLTKNELKKQIGLGCLDKLETAILNLIENNSDGLPTDLIAENLNLDISETSAALLKLEIAGLIKNTPGQIYIRAY